MIRVSDFKEQNRKVLEEKYQFTYEKSMKVFELVQVFFEDDDIVGFSKIVIVEDNPKLVEFVLEDHLHSSDGLFFMKVICSKVMDLGYDYLVNETTGFRSFQQENTILFESFLKGC